MSSDIFFSAVKDEEFPFQVILITFLSERILNCPIKAAFLIAHEREGIQLTKILEDLPLAGIN